MKNILSSMFLTSISLFFIAACTKTDPLSNLDARAVVEGYLAAGDTIDVKITKEIPFGSDSTTAAEPIDNLTVSLETDGKTISLKGIGDGHYTAQSLIQAEKTYKLKFDYNGKTVTATTTIPTKPQNFKTSVTVLAISKIDFSGGFPTSLPSFPDPVKLTWTNSDNTFYLSAIKNLETSPEAVFGGTINFGGRRPPVFNRPTQSNSTEIETRRIEYYGNHLVLLMHVQPEYAALYENSGNSSLSLSPPPTNIENGLGIFTGFAADTLKLLVKKP
jgi:hypothetical protein